jgi:hypothetical protein
LNLWRGKNRCCGEQFQLSGQKPLLPVIQTNQFDWASA